MMEDKSVLVIENLSYEINGFKILKDINLTIGKGEFVGLVGPNGAGKTTLLKCINGINRASGSLRIKGMDLARLTDKRIAREVALMHQNTTISFPFPAIDVVMMGRYPHIKRMSGESLKDYEIARKSMEYTDTVEYENRDITQLSGGERQRVLFAKVLAQEAELILLDEPTASLDITHQEQIFRYSRQLCDSGQTVIAAVHDLKIASHYCSQLVLMKEGRIIASGNADDVLTPENLSEAYGVNALVYRNRITGLLDFHIYKHQNGTSEKRVHIIGGGGSASGVIRELYENGFKVSAGVFTPGDSDLQCAEVFGIERAVCQPFSAINDTSFSAAVNMIKSSELTILCNMPFGMLNIRNLEAAVNARRLVIIEDDPPEARDFTGGKALELYNELKHKAVVTTSARLHEVI